MNQRARTQLACGLRLMELEDFKGAEAAFRAGQSQLSLHDSTYPADMIELQRLIIACLDALMAKGGKATSPRKKTTSAANGKKGGKRYHFIVKDRRTGLSVSRHAAEAGALRAAAAVGPGVLPEVVGYSDQLWENRLQEARA